MAAFLPAARRFRVTTPFAAAALRFLVTAAFLPAARRLRVIAPFTAAPTRYWDRWR